MTENDPKYRSFDMLHTPEGGHELRRISGNAEDIHTRGKTMKDLGERMQMAANALSAIASGTEGKGASIDKLRDSADDVHSDLKKAGIRYAPSGEVLAAYGETLGEVQGPISTIVGECETLWATVRTKSTDLETATQSGEDTSTLQSEFDTAVQNWRDEAVKYNAHYDSWDTAYENARTGLKDANDNGVKDSWLDNALPFLDALGTVLTWVGIALVVAACIIGGPFVLAAALVGLAALGVTLLRYAGGRATLTDVVFAAIAVFPFGKAFGALKGISKAAGPLGKLTAGLKGGKGMLGDLIGLGSKTSLKSLKGILKNGTLAKVFHGSGALNKSGSTVLRNFFGKTGQPGILSRLTQGFDNAAGAHLTEAAASLSNKAKGNLAQFLSNTPGGKGLASLMGDSGGAIDKILNFVDASGKGGLSFAHDQGWI
jgi:hypothetical protein